MRLSWSAGPVGKPLFYRVLHDYRARDLAEKLFDAFKTEHGQ